jgi:hypothetical protein
MSQLDDDALGDMTLEQLAEWADEEDAVERELERAAAVGEAPELDVYEPDVVDDCDYYGSLGDPS